VLPNASACQAIQFAQTTAPQPRTARSTGDSCDPSDAKARPCGCLALLPVSPHGSQRWKPHRIFARPLCLRAFVVWSVVAGNNYQLIVIANRRHCFPIPRPENYPYQRPALPDTRPVCQMAAVAPVGLGLRATPPTWPEDSSEKLSFTHRNFAASRLRVRPWSRPDLPSA